MDPEAQKEHPAPRELHVLDKKRYDFERPTATHYTLEVAAYWDNDLLDQIESGRRRRVTVGAYTGGRSTDLTVELPLEAKRFTLARIRGKSAFITVPEQAQVALRTDDGAVTRQVTRARASAPFAAYAVQIGFGDRLAFRVGKLTFLCQFVRSHGRARHPLDWLLP